MEILNLPEKEERIELNYHKKEERNRGEWSEIVPEVPYYSSLQRYLDFSYQFSYALPVASLEERDRLNAKNGDVVKFEDRWFIFTGGEE